MVSRKYRLEGMMTCLQDIHVKNALLNLYI